MKREFLCQAGPGVSCGACCGLYNVPDPSAGALGLLLDQRTRAFAGVSRNPEAILAFGEQEAGRREPRPMPEFHHCPFLGLTGDPPDRPGCMLHPLAPGNEGADFRDLCHWGGMACRLYACPTHGLPTGLSEVLAAACNDWHLYGLVMPETEMLRTFFSLAGDPDPGTILSSEKALAAVARFAALRRDWPFRAPAPLAAYFFNDGLYPMPATDHAALGRPPSPLEPVLRALGTRFPLARDLDRALETLRARVLALSQAAGTRARL